MLVLYRNSLTTVLIMCLITCVLALIIYIRRLRYVKKLESNMPEYYNYIIKMIENIDYLLKNLDIESIDDSSYEKLKHISERLAYYYENIENVSDILKLNKVYISLKKMESDIILILNGEFKEKTCERKEDKYNLAENEDVCKSDIIIEKYLKILELPKDTNNIDIIQSAYRSLSKKYHPDRNKSFEAKQKFEEIKDAYIKLKKYYK